MGIPRQKKQLLIRKKLTVMIKTKPIIPIQMAPVNLLPMLAPPTPISKVYKLQKDFNKGKQLDVTVQRKVFSQRTYYTTYKGSSTKHFFSSFIKIRKFQLENQIEGTPVLKLAMVKRLQVNKNLPKNFFQKRIFQKTFPKKFCKKNSSKNPSNKVTHTIPAQPQ